MIVFEKINSIIYYLFIYPVYTLTFKRIGKKTRILKPLRIEGARDISLGNDIVIGKYTWLACKPLKGKLGTLQIGSGARIGNFNHIYATLEIIIGENVLIADKVYISDNQHSYESIVVPILKQPIKQLRKVNVGDGTWIGENVCIMGVSIGKNCVVGANSVVIRDIPDFCVAVGNPARVIKRYCNQKNIWLKITATND